jgi:hypothetical protein
LCEAELFGLAVNWKRADSRLRRLAERLDAAVSADRAVQEEFERLARMRIAGAGQLHAVCLSFAAEIGKFLKHAFVVVDPPEFQGERFRENGPNLIQVHASGRIIQLDYRSPGLPISTEEYRDPYILHGTVRSFNQELLDRDTVEEHQIFLCIHRGAGEWRFFDSRTYRGGAVDLEYLTSLFERLL